MVITIGLFFLAKLAALVYSLSISFYIRRRKMNTELVQPVQLKRTNLMKCRKVRATSSWICGYVSCVT